MSREWLFVITFVVVSCLAGGVAYGMFKVGTMQKFEMSKLYFAASILAFLAYIMILAMIFYAFGPTVNPPAESAGKNIFDACISVIPPIVTLIIGFYFGASQVAVSQPKVNDSSVISAPPTSSPSQPV